MQQAFQHEDGKRDAGDAPYRGQQERLGQELQDDLAAASAKRDPDREFRLAGRATSEQ
jgi:hypothetical protein